MTNREFLDFILATINAIGEISKQEAGDAIVREWELRYGRTRTDAVGTSGGKATLAVQVAEDVTVKSIPGSS